MQKFTLRGIMKEVGEVKEFASGFKKRTIIVETGTAEYPSPIAMSLKKSHIDDANGFMDGDRVEVDFTVDGRRWDNPAKGPQYFVDLTVWAVRSADNKAVATPEQTAKAEAAALGATDPEELPF